MISSFTQRVRHIVLFALKPGTTPEDVVAISQAFMRLREDIPQIRNLEWGRDIRAEDRQGGHTHAFLVTFDSEADRDAYLPHPARKAFIANVLRPHLEKVTVLDYVVREG